MYKKSVKLWFCDFWHEESEEAICRENPIYKMLSETYEIILDKQAPDFLIYSCFPKKSPRFCYYLCPRIYYTAENLPPDTLECDYSFSFEPDSKTNIRLPCYLASKKFSLLLQKHSTNNAADKKTKFCNFIYRNKGCPQRNNFFHILNKLKPVDAAGDLYNNTPGLMDRDSKNWYETKLKFMRPYKFTIAFENESHRGYVTEKITDAFAAGSLPIYWGCPDIAKEFNPAAFINCHDFPSLEKAAEYVMKVDNDDDLYLSYISALPLTDGDARRRHVNNRFADIFASAVPRPAALSWYGSMLRNLPGGLARKIVKKRRKILKKQMMKTDTISNND